MRMVSGGLCSAVALCVGAAVAVRCTAADSFCDNAAWREKTAHQDALSLAFGALYRGEPSLIVSNCCGKAVDTAWRIVSTRRPAPSDARFLRVSFRMASDWPVPERPADKNWGNAVRWYDAVGKQVARISLPALVIGRRFTRFSHVVEKPREAVGWELELGFDSPNVPVGKGLALNSLECGFLAERPPEERMDPPDLQEPVVSFTGPVSPDDGFSFFVSDGSGVDWKSVSVRVDGTDVTSVLMRKGGGLAFPKPAKSWADGLHKVEIGIADSAENRAVSEKFFFIGQPPQGVPDCRLRADGMALVDGKPFFPIGIYGVCRREFNAYDLDRACADLKTGGFNMVHTYSDTGNPAFFSAARRHGLKTWCAFSTPEDKAFMAFQRADASCLARYTGDDTADHHSPSVMRDRHENAKALDPGRLTCQADPILNETSSKSRYRDYVACTDVFMPEIYPVRRDDGATASNCVATVVRDMELARQDIAAADGSTPHGIWPIIQYFKGWGWARFPTEAELEAMTFAAIVHGANGVMFYTYGGFVEPEKKKFNYGVTTSDERWRNMTNLATRISRLAPVLLSETGGRCDPKIVSGPSRDSLGQPSVTALWKQTGGQTYLIAVNATPSAVGASFSLPPSAGGSDGLARVLWEDRFASCRKGELRDEFAPFAVHVYKLGDCIRDVDFTFASIPYGSHPRQVMDVRLPKTVKRPVPVVLFVHGGGWTKGDRREEPTPKLLGRCDRDGFALVAVEYRFLEDARREGLQPPVRGPMADMAAAVAFVQKHADEWKIDPDRIGLTGGSAGACASLAVALQDDNRYGVRAVAAAWPQTSLDPKEMREWIPNIAYGGEAFGYANFDEWLAHRSESLPWIRQFSPAGLVRACDKSRLPLFLFDSHRRLDPGELPKDPTHAGTFSERFAELVAGRGGEVIEVPYGRIHQELVSVLKRPLAD